MKLISFVFPVLFSSLVFAAIPKKLDVVQVRKILQMPGPQRQSAIDERLKENSKNLYNEFIDVAFSKTEAMPLRWQALMAAAQIKKKTATPDLVRASKEAPWFMKTAALMALNEYNSEMGTEVAKSLIKDKALVVRSAAVETLAKNAVSDTRRLLWQELNQNYNFKDNQSLWIRPQIIKVLGEKPMDAEMSSFSLLLKETDLEIQLPAIRGLEKLTGMKLGHAETSPADLVLLWKKQLKVIN